MVMVMDSSSIRIMRYPLVLVVVVLMVVAFASCDDSDSKEKEECAESVVGLATCLPYVGGAADSPTQDCCSSLKQVLNTNKKCVCVMIQDRNDPDLGLNINLTLALALPQACNAPANISQCPALLKLPPNSPDAQIFYQLGQNSTSAGGPNDNVKPSSTSIATPGSRSSSDEYESDGCGNEKRFIGVKIFGGLLFLWSLTSIYAI